MGEVIHLYLIHTYVLFAALILKHKFYDPPKKRDILTIYFGVPGSGKTTLAAHIARKYMKYYQVFSNVPIKGTYQYDVSDLGHVQIENCILLLDEASIDYNNRNWKYGKMDQDAIKFWKLHRHYGVAAFLFSQSWNDCDATLRRLAFQYKLVRKSLLPFFITVVRIKRKISIDEHTHEPCDDYSFDHPVFRIFTNKRYFMPKVWKMFNSWDAPVLPKKIWEKY